MKKKLCILCALVVFTIGGCSKKSHDQDIPLFNEKIETNAIDVFGYRTDRSFKYKGEHQGEMYDFTFLFENQNMDFPIMNTKDKLGFHITFSDKKLIIKNMDKNIPARIQDMNIEPVKALLKEGTWKMVPLRDTYILALDQFASRGNMQNKEPFFKIVNVDQNTELIIYLMLVENNTTAIDTVLSIDGDDIK